MSVDEAEDIEGLDTGSKLDEASAYPLDDVMVRRETRTVSEIIKRVKSGRYSMNPDFQRDFVWDREKQSKLIESCVMRIPLPVLYVAEGSDGRVTVVDGLQRLSTFNAFLNDKLRLQGLGLNNPLEGKLFSNLPINLRERVEDTQLTLYILDASAPEAARLDIFERVNSGVPLTRQQMRNALYSGPATKFLADMASEDEFIEATGGSLQTKTMRDREAINRFCAFYVLGWENYKNGDMDEFLARALSKMSLDNFDLRSLGTNFISSMSANKRLFGRHAFRKSLISGETSAYRSVINIAFFDVMSVSLARLNSNNSSTDVRIQKAVRRLLDDSEFSHYITYSTNSTYQVHGRFKKISAALAGI